MDATKIKALIAELRSDIRVKQQAIDALSNLLASAGSEESKWAAVDGAASPILFSTDDSYVDLAVKVITANQYRPLPMNEIVKGIRLLKANEKIERRSVEATLYRHIKTKGEYARLVKVSPGVYGVKRMPREASTA